MFSVEFPSVGGNFLSLGILPRLLGELKRFINKISKIYFLCNSLKNEVNNSAFCISKMSVYLYNG